MGRRTPPQGIHSSPKKAGIQNMENYKGRKEEDNESPMGSIIEMLKVGHSRAAYKGLWDEDSLRTAIEEFFMFCDERGLKPAKAGLRVWLSISKSNYWEWENMEGSFKQNLLRQANDCMELQYISRAEKYPTANIFLLKSAHGHIETSRMDVTSNGNTISNQDEMDDTIKRLGLNK